MRKSKSFGHIIICRADQVVKKTAQLRPAAVLSIEHPQVKPGEHGSVPRLKGTPQKILTFWDSETPVVGGPDIGQVADGMAFVVEHLMKGDVIIHCNAGVSRSTALALGVLSQIHPRTPPEKLLEKLLEIRPRAAPNIIVVGMVDQLTGRGGKLFDAVKADKAISHSRAMAELGRKSWLKKNPKTYQKMHPEKFPPRRA